MKNSVKAAEQRHGSAKHRSNTVPEDIMGFDFALPSELEASEPPEARGLTRDGVRLMVSHRDNDEIDHTVFRDIGRFLSWGDVLVINTAGTMNASLPAIRQDGEAVELHLSTRLPGGGWSVELRRLEARETVPLLTARSCDRLMLPSGGEVRLTEPYSSPLPARSGKTDDVRVRLWRAEVALPEPVEEYVSEHGTPIRYAYVPQSWGDEYYQTVFATDRGSAEMPSAGRAFTPELVTRLVASGVQFAPLLLHTGVASLEDHEPPYAEYFRVPEDTARIVNSARAAGRRIIAVGTTVIRALETVTSHTGYVRAGEGWTDVIVSPATGVHSVDGLLTGLHEPRATHLMMLEALVSRERLRLAYTQSLERRYLWHEFGDLHLILP